MNKAQWAAIYNFCEDMGYTRKELLEELKANGAVEQNARLEDLGYYADGTDYDDMVKFLTDNL